jgi:hypothetical protein
VKKTDELCPEEIKLAEKLWWKKVQEETFGAEKRQLERGKIVEKRSSIYDLSPQLDEDGVLRLGGRIGFSRSQITCNSTAKTSIHLFDDSALS